MTIAVCIRCGNEKRGALTACEQCTFDPQKPEDQARSIAFSDHYMTHDQLRNASNAIRLGEKPRFDSMLVNQIEQELRSSPGTLRMPIGCHIAVWTPIVIVLILVIAVIVLLIRNFTASP